jgi:hypothetical protein
MSDKVYKIQHITDLINIDADDIDEAFEDLRHGLGTLLAASAVLREAGDTRPLSEICPHINIVIDGRRESRVTVNGKNVFTTRIVKDTKVHE